MLRHLCGSLHRAQGMLMCDPGLGGVYKGQSAGPATQKPGHDRGGITVGLAPTAH